MEDIAAFKYRVKIAMQLSFIIYIMLGIFMFYAAFETRFRMWGTFFLLLAVLMITPFLPDNASSCYGRGPIGEGEEE